MIKKIILVSIILLCCGCYDYRELNDLDIIDGIYIDFDNNNYYVYYEVVNTKDIDSNYYMVMGYGNNLGDAFDNANKLLDDDAYFEHLKIVFISKNINILDISNYFMGNDFIDTDFYLVVSNYNISNYFNKLYFDESVSSFTYKLLNNINYTKYYNTFDYIVSKIVDNHSNILLPSIDIDDDNISLGNYVIYKDSNYYRELDFDDEIIYKIFNFNDDVIYGDSNKSIKIYNSKIKYYFKNNNIYIKIKLDCMINDLDSEYDLRDSNTYYMLEDYFNNKLSYDIDKFIYKMKCDYFEVVGILDMAYKYDYKNYYKEYFYDRDIYTDIDVNINKTGFLGDLL